MHSSFRADLLCVNRSSAMNFPPRFRARTINVNFRQVSANAGIVPTQNSESQEILELLRHSAF